MSTAQSPAPFDILGPALTDGNLLNNLFAQPHWSTQDGITALAGGMQTNATALTATVNRVTTVVSPGDSVRLPSLSKGLLFILVYNDTANPIQVFGHDLSTINDIAAGTGFSQPAFTGIIYAATAKGRWYTFGLSSSNPVSATQASRGTAATTVTSSTTLVNVTGLTANMVAGGVYDFYVHIPCTSDSAGGTKAAMGGTATWTSINTTVQNNTASAIGITTGTTATPGTSIAGTTATNIQVIMQGTVVCNAAGTLTAMFAQNASDATPSVALANSFMNVVRVA